MSNIHSIFNAVCRAGLVVGMVFCNTVSASFEFTLETLSEDLDRPWGITHIGNNRLLITERDGGVRYYDSQQLKPAIDELPSVYNVGQGGLLDVIAHPNFANNQTLYFTMSRGSATNNGTHVIRAKWQDNTLSEIKTIFTPTPSKKQALHYSGRIAFMPDNSLVFAVGDGYLYMDDAQKLDSHLGKIVRIYDDGSVPADNPFVNQTGVLPEIYSYGHRNPQGMYFDHKRQLLFSNEHGPKGGDEVNLIKPGNNYGWPAITYGVDYSGDIISELTHKDGMEQPLLHWTPSIAPSALLVYYGKEFPALNGHVLTTALKFTQLRLIKLAGAAEQLKVVAQEVYLKEKGERIRDLEIDAQGRIYLITDSGKLWRLSAKS